MTDIDRLKADLLQDRLASYHRLRGGWPVALAGALYWGMLASLGVVADTDTWMNVALWTSGLIFPLALLLAKIAKNDFMQDRTATGDVILPAFIAMLLFFPMLFTSSAETFPLMLDIGMSLHWPVIGWSYGKTALYSAHAVVRAVVVLIIWIVWPDMRMTALPLAVAIIYIGTIAIIIWETRDVRCQTA